MEIRTPEGITSVMLKAPGIVRWNDGDHRYRIADGHRLWRVDESTGNVTEEPTPLPADGINALTLLNLTKINTTSLRSIRPTSHETIDGIDCRVYEADVQFKDQPAQLRAITNSNTGELTSLHLQKWSQLPKGSGIFSPLVEVRLTALNAALPSEAFRIRRSLKDDGRRGSFAEVHGLVFVRAFPGHRWTPATNNLPLFIGDQIRCEAGGANAAILRLNGGTEITLGPSALLEIGASVRLLRGDAKVAPAQSSRLAPPRRAPMSLPGQPKAGLIDQTAPQGTVRKDDERNASSAALLGTHHAERDGDIVGPNGNSIAIAEPMILRATIVPQSLTRLDVEPAWLTTLTENVTAETMGSLVAQVDGRDVSLSLGFHHVTVEIRDQIARTVIEESFVNNTDQRLEGQFHFPLPHDASISGFGMWIGDQLVEADVVENSEHGKSTKPFCAKNVIRDCLNGKVATFLKLACSRSKLMAKRRFVSPTLKRCLCRTEHFRTTMHCEVSCCSRLRCETWRSM